PAHGFGCARARTRDLGRPRASGVHASRHRVPAADDVAPQRRGQYPLCARCRRRAARAACRPRPRARRARRSYRARTPASTQALRRRATAACARTRARQGTANPPARRADREPRSGRDQGDRRRHPQGRREWHQGGDVDPRSRRGQAARRRNRAGASRPRDRERSGRRLLFCAQDRGGAPIHRRRAAGLTVGNLATAYEEGQNIMPTRRSLVVWAAPITVVAAAPARAQDKSIVVASTTSTQDSGLFGHILPLFKAKTGIDVKVVAQGTGQALDTGRRGDADVLFVHAKAQEEKFVADGFGVKRYRVMYNDFVLIGPKSDPAGIKGMTDVAEALKAIKSKGAPFISRGDRSGTHIAELDLWKAAGIDIGKEKGPWYKEIGQGMGAALNTASAANAYVLADRGTWLSFKNRG